MSSLPWFFTAEQMASVERLEAACKARGFRYGGFCLASEKSPEGASLVIFTLLRGEECQRIAGKTFKVAHAAAMKVVEG